MPDPPTKILCGADVELHNHIEGVDRANGSGREAANRLLDEIDGLPPPSRASYTYRSHGGHNDQRGNGHHGDSGSSPSRTIFHES